jgi:Holliday junction resolvase
MVAQGRRGTRAENQVGDELGDAGYDVVRSAASKGAADLVAVHDNEVLFIQVKLGVYGKPFKIPSPAERRELYRIAHRAQGFPVAACRIPGAGARKATTVYRLLTGEGPFDFVPWLPRGRRGGGLDPAATEVDGCVVLDMYPEGA